MHVRSIAYSPRLMKTGGPLYLAFSYNTINTLISLIKFVESHTRRGSIIRNTYCSNAYVFKFKPLYFSILAIKLDR